MFARFGLTAGWLQRLPGWSGQPLRLFSVSSPLPRDRQVIYNATKRPEPVLTEEFRNKIKEGFKHPRGVPVYEPSEEFKKNVMKVFDKVFPATIDHIDKYVASGEKLEKFVKHRHVPLEKGEIKARKNRIEDMLKEEFSLEEIDKEDIPDKAVMRKLKKLESSNLCRWAPIEFDEVGSLTYLLTRSAAEFSSLRNIFQQIKEKNPTFQPRTMFDLGSGVCTGLWAVQDTFGKVSEAFLVDPSKHMNDLARLILGGGDGFQIPAGISFRLHTPSSVDLQYDLVLCSNTLLELPTAEERLTSIHNLWARVGEEGYLVLVETGTNAGFHVIAEARDYLNQLSLMSQDDDALHVGHAVAPCPHDSACPRHAHDTIPCNFPIRYRNFEFRQLKPDLVQTELISYLVFKKSGREGGSLPRLVENPVRAKSCTYCRLCTSMGTLQEVLVRKKDDDDLFQLSKRMKCGDELPVNLKEWVDKPKIGTPWMKRKQTQN